MRATLKKDFFWPLFLTALILFGVFEAVKSRPKLEQKLYTEAQEDISRNQFKSAVERLQKITAYVPKSEIGIKASAQGGQLALYELQDYNTALFFFRNIVRHSEKTKEILAAQKKIAEIFYEKLSDYPQAILELNRVLQLEALDAEKQQIHQKIAQAYFYAGNFTQTIMEAEEFLKKWPESNRAFNMWALKINALIATKAYDDAIKTIDIVLKAYAQSEGIQEVHLSKAQCYEEKKEWDKAIQILKDLKSTYPQEEVIDMRIKSILRRKEKRRAI